MHQFSMNEVTTYRWSFDEDVAHYRAAGISAIGVWRRKLSDFGEEKGIELLADSGLKVSNLLWAGGFTGSDGRSFRESVDDALEAIRLASAMHASCLVVYSGARAGHTHNHARRLLREALKELGAAAGQADLVLALEPMHPGCASEWTFLTNLQDTLSLLDALECPAVQLAFDTYHLGRDPAAVQCISEIADRIAVVHLGDGRQCPDNEQNRCRLGEGSIPLKSVLSALASAGYRGYYDVELLGEEIESSNYQDLLEHSKQAYRELLAYQEA